MHGEPSGVSRRVIAATRRLTPLGSPPSFISLSLSAHLPFMGRLLDCPSRPDDTDRRGLAHALSPACSLSFLVRRPRRPVRPRAARRGRHARRAAADPNTCRPLDRGQCAVPVDELLCRLPPGRPCPHRPRRPDRSPPAAPRSRRLAEGGRCAAHGRDAAGQVATAHRCRAAAHRRLDRGPVCRAPGRSRLPPGGAPGYPPGIRQCDPRSVRRRMAAAGRLCRRRRRMGPRRRAAGAARIVTGVLHGRRGSGACAGRSACAAGRCRCRPA